MELWVQHVSVDKLTFPSGTLFFCGKDKKHTMVCDITLYHDSDYRGGSQNITSTKTDLNSGSAVPRNAASSYKVNADESCLITGWTFPDLANNGSSRGRFLRGDEPNFNWRRKWN